MGVVASYAVVRAAEHFSVDPMRLALGVLEKLIAVQRARTAVADMHAAEAEIEQSRDKTKAQRART